MPVYRLDLVERWVGDTDEAEPPQVHRIGGRQWKTLKRKTEAAIEKMTAELLELYARREAASGFAYSPDTRWQKEMESSFLYEDTPDQRKATEDVKRDMESDRPMDRLICGDVGYGKTEIAIRAAFKAVQDGKQVAVLAPTTILVEQHRHTFEERVADYPVRVEALSRFRTPSEVKAHPGGGGEGRGGHRHRDPPPPLLRRPLPRAGAPGGGRGAALRGEAQGAPQAAPAPPWTSSRSPPRPSPGRSTCPCRASGT